MPVMPGSRRPAVCRPRHRPPVVFNTSHTPPEREQAVFGDPLEPLWKRCVFPLCGVQDVVRRMVGPMSGSSAEDRARWLAEVRALAEEAAALAGA